jgi:VWFA-related protein
MRRFLAALPGSRRLKIGLILPLWALAQQAPQTPPAPRPQAQSQVQPATARTTFTVNTQLVIEEVTVKDKNGKAVEGLRKEDFSVTEDGKPQTIKFFEFENIDQAAPAQELQRRESPAPPAAAPAPAIAPLTQVQIKPEAPGNIQYRDRRLLALYFDMKSMPVPDQLHALDAARKFVRTQMGPADLMAIMEYDGASVKTLLDFTGDREKLEGIITQIVASEDDDSVGVNADAGAADTGAAFGQDDSEFNIFNTDRQLAALQTAAKMLGSLNEKKALVYFASGMQLNGLDNQAQLRATINDAIRSGVTLWPVDARGLTASAPLGNATTGSQGNSGMYTGAAALANLSNLQRSQDTLYTLASDTGGKAMLDFNDLSMGIVQAEQSITSYYMIGYYSSNEALDGKFRRIKVALNNGMQATFDFRQGYFAGKEFGKFTAADKERQLEEALLMGDPITELTMAMEVNYFRLNSAEYFTPIMVKIPGSELALARKRGAEHTLIDFIGEIKNEHGVTVQNLRDFMDIKLTEATVEEWTKRPIEYDTGYTLLPGPYQIKVLARDSETGRIGTYIGAFTIPNLSKEQQRVPITSVVLSSQRAAMKDALATAGKPSQAALTQAANPLVQDGQKLIPSVTRVFSSRGDMYVYLQAYEAGATAAQPLVAYVTFFRGAAKAMETPLVKVADGLDPKSHMLPVKLSFPLGKLKPGEYDCEVTVLDPTSRKAAFWQAPVMIIP